MAWLDKRTGRWQGEVTLKGLGRFKRSFAGRKEAEAYELWVNLHRSEPAGVVEEGRPMPTRGRSFRELAEACKAAGGPHGVWHDGKDKSQEQRLDFCIARIGDYDIAEVTRALVRDRIIADLRKRPVPGIAGKPRSQGTINNYVTQVAGVLKWATNEGIIAQQPKLEFKKPKDRKDREAITFELEDAICERMEAAGYHHMAVCVRFLVETGMRSGEVLERLRPEQIANDHVLLEKAQVKNNTPRLVYVRPELAREMRALIAAGALPDATHLLRVFQKAAKAAGSESHVTIHSLRHTRNTRLYLAGVEKAVRKKLLGHTSSDVNDMYLHVPLDKQREIAQRVGELRGERKVDATITPFSASIKTGT